MVKEFIKKHERLISVSALATGFLWDTITLTRIDYLFEVIVLGTHSSLIILWILLINIIDGGKLNFQPFKFLRPIMPILMQVSFGALFSGLTVFYIKSASFSTTLLFVIILAALLIGNEFFRGRYQQFIFQFVVLYVALSSFFALYFPVLFSAINVFVFIAAQIAALLIIYLLVVFLKLFCGERVRASRNGLRITLGSVFALMLIFYFSNVIPPVPLALKDKGAYYAVERVGNTFVGVQEKKSFVQKIIPDNTLYIQEGDSVTVFSSIFAPTDLETSIAHRWEKYNPITGNWVPQGTISFPISGGRNEGYRGYTFKSALSEGRWRVSVITKRNQVLGRIGFSISLEGRDIETEPKEL